MADFGGKLRERFPPLKVTNHTTHDATGKYYQRAHVPDSGFSLNCGNSPRTR